MSLLRQGTLPVTLHLVARSYSKQAQELEVAQFPVVEALLLVQERHKILVVTLSCEVVTLSLCLVVMSK